MNNKILEVKNLVVQYVLYKEIVEAVNSLSFEINQNEILGLVGETGAGKTTTALGIIGLIPDPPGKVIKGEILYKGQDILKKNEKELRKIRGSEIAMIFQDPMTSLNPLMTVGDQIKEVVQLHYKISKAEAIEKARQMLEHVGIPRDRYNEYPYQFSGGMKQRVIIAISLACNPHVLIADEPTTALDVTIQAQILELINNLKTEFNTAILLITHDLSVVAEMCDKVALMYAGEIVEYGSLKDIFLSTQQHPYTKGLFKCIPDLDVESDRLENIKGMMPDPLDLPKGCKFYPRCPYKSGKCKTANPEAVEVSPGHKIKCLLYKDK